MPAEGVKVLERMAEMDGKAPAKKVEAIDGVIMSIDGGAEPISGRKYLHEAKKLMSEMHYDRNSLPYVVILMATIGIDETKRQLIVLKKDPESLYEEKGEPLY